MKFIGAILLWITLILIGITNSYRLKNRVIQLEKTKVLIQRIKIEIEYTNISIPDIIHSFSNQRLFEQLEFLKSCSDKMSNFTDFPIAWKDSVQQNSKFYTKDERDKLLQLADTLGTSDLNGQMNLLELYLNYFEKYLLVANEQKEKYANMSIFISTILGFAIFILAI